MNQVDETKTFALSVTPPAGSGVYAYVWQWWDGTTTVTSEPRTEKTLNIGGDPTNSRKLLFTCRPVMEDGQSVVMSAEIIVNNPPSVVPSPVISNNDDFFPYPTQISLTAYDVENDAISFLYYNSAGQPIGGGSSTYVGVVNGTWNGTGGVYSGTNNVFTTTILTDTTITLKLVDAQAGTRVIDFNFYGNTPPAPVIGVTAEADTLTADATSVPDQRIGPGQNISFAVYAADPVSSNFDFLWSFFGSYGWVGNSFSTGTSTPTQDGSVRNSYIKDIAGETGGNKTVLVKVTNVDSGKHLEIPIYVTLIANTVTSTCTFTVTDEDGTSYAAGAHVVAGKKLYYKATAVDPQNDVLVFRWSFAQPTGINPATSRMWGREVMLDTTGFPSGTNIIGSIIVIDRMNGQASFAVPTLIIT